MKHLKKFKIFEANGQPIVNISGIDLEYYPDTAPNFDDDGDDGGDTIYLSIPDNWDETQFTEEEVSKIKKAVTELGLEFGEDMGEGMILVNGDITVLDWLADNKTDDYTKARERILPGGRTNQSRSNSNSPIGDEQVYETIIKKYIPLALTTTDTDKLTIAGGGFLFTKQLLTNAVDLWLEDNPQYSMDMDEVNKLEDELKEYWRPF